MKKPLPVRAFILGMLLWAATIVSAAEPTTAAPPTPYRALRYQRFVGQTDWYTCGPAAVATLLTSYYGIPTSELEMVQLTLQAMEGTGKDPTEGMTLLSLKQALEFRNITSKGYRLTLESLVDYFRQGGLPLIVHVTRPQLHYVVGIGVVGDYFVLGDPSFGNRILPISALTSEKGFAGIVLVPILTQSLAHQAKVRQSESLAYAERRLAQLEALKERLP